MHEKNCLPPGRQFEEFVFGEHGETEDEIPEYESYRDSLASVAQDNWARFARFSEGGELFHCPSRPTMGQSFEIWKSVKVFLPRRVEGSSANLDFFLALGSPANFFHGIDAFFWWHGVFATIDASLIPKQKIGLGERYIRGTYLKADFLISPPDLESEGLALLGKRIADLLIKRMYDLRRRAKPRKRKKVPKV